MPSANNPNYDPSRPPQFEHNTDATTLAMWLYREFAALSISLLDTPALELRPITQPPVKPREGMIVYVDGTSWNPTGHGKGPYVFSYDLWLPMVNRPSAPATVTGATYTVVPSDDLIIVNSSVNVVLTLPDPSARPGRILTVKTINNVLVSSSVANVVPLQGTTPGTVIIPTAGKNAWSQLVSDGTNWVIMMEA